MRGRLASWMPTAASPSGSRPVGIEVLRVVVAQVSDTNAPDMEPPTIVALRRYGGNVTYRNATGTRRKIWHWRVVASSAEAFLRLIRPYMIGKAAQANVALEYRKHVRAPGERNPDGINRAEARPPLDEELQLEGSSMAPHTPSL